MRSIVMLAAGVLMLALSGCTGTPPILYEAMQNGPIDPQPGMRVAVFRFVGPDAPQAREATAHALVQRFGATIVPFGKVDQYAYYAAFAPNDLDPSGIKKAAHDLGANLVVWGTVNQFSPYYFNRWTPAQPPYLDQTVTIASGTTGATERLSARMQGEIPATIYDRQPTFADLSTTLSARIVAAIR